MQVLCYKIGTYPVIENVVIHPLENARILLTEKPDDHFPSFQLTV